MRKFLTDQCPTSGIDFFELCTSRQNQLAVQVFTSVVRLRCKCQFDEAAPPIWTASIHKKNYIGHVWHVFDSSTAKLIIGLEEGHGPNEETANTVISMLDHSINYAVDKRVLYNEVLKLTV